MLGLIYKILHLLEKCWNETRWGFQRMFVGYDERVIWGVGEYLCTWMPKWISIIRKKKQGIPMELLPEVIGRDYTREEECIAAAKFDCILQDISDGFEAGKRWIDGDLYPTDFDIYKILSAKDKKLFDKSLKLFVKYFFDISD